MNIQLIKLKNLAAKTTFGIALSLGVVCAPAHAGIPVVDGTNLTQNVMAAVENVAQTLKQIQQYQTQLQQYENQLQNTMAPAAYIWDQAQSTMNNLRSAMNTLDHYQNQLGSLDAYLGKFQDVAYYRSSPCFNGSGGCTDAEWAAMNENRRLASESQKKANDALFRTLSQQQDALQDDARTLEQLQSRAQGADGQMQALGYANQLASQQSNQLLQMRAILVAQQQAVAAQMQSQNDREAIEQAASEQLRRGEYQASPARNW